MYAIWLSENISMASTRGFFHQQKESLSPDEITPTFTRKASKIRASLCQVQKGFARIALAFVGNGHKDDLDRICKKTRLYAHAYRYFYTRGSPSLHEVLNKKIGRKAIWGLCNYHSFAAGELLEKQF